MPSSAARDWPDTLTVAPIASARGTVRLPGSKSLSNRALLLAALARGTTRLSNLLDADDTRVMIDALTRLGVVIERDGDVVRVTGCGGSFPRREAELFLGNAGTAMRSLTAALAFTGGTYRLDGVARMRERPIGDLVDALNALGARIAYAGQAAYPPLRIEPVSALASARVSVRGDVSSQFLSGLLMAAPGVAPAEGLSVEVAGTLISQPYVMMTRAIMNSFGVEVQAAPDGHSFLVPRAAYAAPGDYAVEGDASAASYFLALGAIAGGPVRVTGAGRASVQGDVGFARVLERMGAQVNWGDDWIECARGETLAGRAFDCNKIPDAAMTACIVALFARGATRLTGIGSWRVKETDRIAAMAAELRKLGAQVEEGPDWIEVAPPSAGSLREATIDTYDDHRIAMCFSLAAAGGVPVHIREPRCVAKTFPDYFEALARLVTPLHSSQPAR
jgi:3-phosphoshikimate 1-carboxyvinyltransferase